MAYFLKKKLLIFDIDNTILLWKESGLWWRHQNISKPLRQAQKSIAFKRGLRKHSCEETVQYRSLPIAQFPQNIESDISAWIQQSFTWLNQNQIPIGIFSDLPHPELHHYFATFQIQHIIDGQWQQITKPLPDALWQLAALFGVPPTQIILIGDQRSTDQQSAFAMGAHFFNINDIHQQNPQDFFNSIL